MRFSVLLFFLVCAILATSVVLAQADRKAEADKLYNEGNALFRAGNHAGAIEKYNGALQIAQDFKYYYQLGLSYKNAQQDDKAIAALQESTNLRPDFSLGHYALGGTLLSCRNHDKAIEAFKLALKHEPNMDKALKGIGEAYAGQIQQLINDGKFSESVRLAEEAMTQQFGNSKVYLLAAMIYNKTEQPEKALVAAEEALKLKKRGAKGAEHFEIGIAHKKLRAFEKARIAFIEARKDPTYSRNAQYELDGLKGR